MKKRWLALVVAGTLAVSGLVLAGVGAFDSERLEEIRRPLVGDRDAQPVPVDPNAPTSGVVGPLLETFPGPRSLDGDLRRLPQNALVRRERPELGTPQGLRQTNPGVAPKVQTVAAAAPATSLDFAGLDYFNWGNGHPADPNGDIGPDHYIEGVNTSIGIYDRTNGTRLYAGTFNSLFSGNASSSTDPCAIWNYGDPYVIYDRASGRWIISDFAFASPSTGPYYQCIAVSKTVNPMSGGWWLYTIKISDTQLNDYPKFGAWNDGIYMSVNLFTRGSSYAGVKVYNFNRADLISGASPLRAVAFNVGTNAYSLLPANDEFGASAGPEYFYSDAVGLQQWKFTTNWATPANSTLTGPVDLSSQPSYSGPSLDAAQKDTSTRLDVMGDRLMSAAQWSRTNGSVWLSRSVNPPSGTSGVLWMEVTPGASPTVKQSGVLDLADGLYRFMPSLAVDASGNMAVGYSTSSSSSFPGLRYAARTVGATAGTLDVGEGTLYSGAGSQTGSSRWGDYYSMSIDPKDSCTFWMTGSHMAATGGNWQTRIVKFSPASCSAAPIAPTITQVSPSTAIVGSQITISGTGFEPGMTVKVNDVTATNVQVMSSMSALATIPTVSTGAAVVKVTNSVTTVTNSTLTIVPARTLSVSKVGTGTVTASAVGINCGSTCSAVVADGTSVTLTVSAATGYTFTGWSGDCSGNLSTCTLSLTGGNKSAVATFKQTTVITYTGAKTANRGANVTLSAKLTAGSAALMGKPITLSLNGQSCSTTPLTSSTGTVSCVISAPTSAGSYTALVAFAGDTTYAPSSTSAIVKVK